MDEIFDRIKDKFKHTKVNHKFLVASLIATEILGILVFIYLLRVPLSQKFLTLDPKAYSVVSLNPQKRYLVAQNDLLTGKAIPNSKIKVLITPDFIKDQVTADSKGDWWYQVPANLQQSVHTLTFGNFDKKNKLVTFQSHKFRVLSNISLFKLTDSIWKRANQLFTPNQANAQTDISNLDYYTKTGLPNPGNPAQLSDDTIFRLRNYYLPYAYTASKITGADWKVMTMFSYKEDGITNYLDNCFDGKNGTQGKENYGPDADYDPNTPCTGWAPNGTPNWQVGWGIIAGLWADQLPEAIAVMRPGKTIQEIGQEVIDNSHDESRHSPVAINITTKMGGGNYVITEPTRFPEDVTLDQIIEGSKPVGNGDKSKTCRPDDQPIGNGGYASPEQDPKDCQMRQLLGILMKDPAISAYLLALTWKDFSGPQTADEIKRLGGYDLQEVSNIIAGIENATADMDLEALVTTPRITIPVAVATQAQQDPVYPIDGVQVETVVSQNGNSLTDQEISDQNQKTEIVVLPAGVNPVDFGYGANPGNYTYQPGSQNNVKGVTSPQEISLEADALANPGQYQICALLKSAEYEVIEAYDCIPLDRVIDPQIPIDSSASNEAITEEPREQIIESLNDSQTTTPSSCADPDWSDQESSGDFICRGNEACYKSWQARPENSCQPEETGELCGYDERCVQIQQAAGSDVAAPGNEDTESINENPEEQTPAE